MISQQKRILRSLMKSRFFSSTTGVNPIAYQKKTPTFDIPPPEKGRPSIFHDVDFRFVPVYVLGFAVSTYALYKGYNWMIESLFSPNTIPAQVKQLEEGSMVVIQDGKVVSTLPPIPTAPSVNTQSNEQEKKLVK